MASRRVGNRPLWRTKNKRSWMSNHPQSGQMGSAMNKPLPWNIKGVGFDAREAARIAAKRAGMPLGEWLNGVISARAAELGVQVEDIEPDDRLEAIAARLSDDEAPASSGDAQRGQRGGVAVATRDAPVLVAPKPAPAPVDALQPAPSSRVFDVRRPVLAPASFADGLDSRVSIDRPKAPASSVGNELNPLGSRATTQVEAEQLDARLATILEKLNRSFAAAEELERAPAPVPDPPRPAPATVTPLPVRTPAPIIPAADPRPTATLAGQAPQRSGGDDFAELHAAFKDLARRLDGQAALPEAADAGAAAADLAAEVAALGQRVDQLRAPVRDGNTHHVPEMQTLRSEMAQLSSALSQLAPQQSLAALEAAVRDLAGQVDLSRLDGVGQAVLAPVERLSREVREAIRAADASPAVDGLRRDMAAMSTKVDALQQRDADPKIVAGLRRELRDMREAFGTLTERFDVAERLQAEVIALGDRVGMLAERSGPTVMRDLSAAVGEIRNLLRGYADAGAIGALDKKIDSLALQIDAFGRSTHDVNALYGLVGNLADRLDEARNPLAGADALTALQAQMGALAHRLDQTSSTDATLQGLERLIGDLFLQIEQSRNVAIDAAENAARAAAQDTLRAAMDNPALNGAELTMQTGLDVDHVSQELAELRRVQETSDRRVNTTLTALNTTLERLVDRLAADGARQPVDDTAPVPVKAGRRRGTPAMPEPVVDGRASGPAMPAFDPEQFLVEPGSEPGARFSGVASLDEVVAADGRANGGRSTDVAPLIAAARRAAQAAQASALEASLKADAPTEAAASPIGRTRSFFAGKRRALLLGLAGLVLAAGTLQIVRLTDGHDGEAGTAATEPASDEPAQADRSAAAEGAAAPADAKPTPPKAGPAVTPAPTGAVVPVPPPGSGASLQAPAGTADKIAAAIASSTPGGTTQPQPLPGQDAVPTGVSQSLRDLAAAGNAAAQYEIGARLSDGRGLTRDAKQALGWFQRSAQQGFAPAQYRLASLYEKGVGTAVDAALAVAWYEKSAAQGNVRAMHNLAVMSAEGAVGKPDYGKAVTWFTKAASYGVRDSQFNLAVLFARGLGVPQSLDQSYAWFAVAAQQGDGDAVTKRDAVAAKLDAKALADAKATVASFHPLKPDTAANDVTPPPGGWDGATTAKAAARKSEARLTM